MSRKSTSVSRSKVLMTVITAIFTCLIFLQSAMPASASTAESGGFTAFINNFLISLKLDITLSHTFVRKLGHFTEFFVLGCLLTATDCTYVGKPHKNIFTLFFFGLATAVADETIQIFIDGRAAMIEDVLLDFFGVLCGVGISLLFICIKNAFRR